MTAHREIDREDVNTLSDQARLIRIGLEPLRSFADQALMLRRALMRLAEIGDKVTRKSALRLIEQVDAIEPSVTMIGQVKSGKTSLVNAMIGQPGLLPADVNPWTSVVTSLHLSPTALDVKPGARFRFFDNDEWGRLIDSGGRLGELASRAGADEELAKVRDQITEMRERSRKRLGRKFELLLGQEHDYGYYDRELIERYVCLGDDFEGDAGAPSAPANQGRFADITKSAALALPTPGMPTRLCIRDTPGVNDTFMMREQITINSIRESRLCVVVLSAHQALTTMDMALVRLIANVKSRDVLIFVNRIDELASPATEVAEIRTRIIETLAAHHGPANPQIVFGSALWANASLRGTLDSLPRDSAAALLDWAAVAAKPVSPGQSTAEIIWDLSGIPALYRAISERIIEGVGAESIQRIARAALNLGQGVQAGDRVIRFDLSRKRTATMTPAEVAQALDRIASTAMQALDKGIAAARADFGNRIERAHRSFLDRATAALIAHLESYGERTVWQYSADGLRVLLRSNYLKFGNDLQRCVQNALTATKADLLSLVTRLIDCPKDQFHIEVPGDLRIPPPVALGQTIALDLQSSWWKSWWFRARGYQAFASKFHDLIKAETDRIMHGLKTNQTDELCSAAAAVVQNFLTEQHTILLNVAQMADASPSDLRDIFGLQAEQDRRSALTSAIDTFTRLSA